MSSHNSSGKYEHIDADVAAIFVLFRFLGYFTAFAANFLFVFETFDLDDAAPATIIFEHEEKNNMLLCLLLMW